VTHTERAVVDRLHKCCMVIVVYYSSSVSEELLISALPIAEHRQLFDADCTHDAQRAQCTRIPLSYYI
jgi:hypothetical protein